MTRARDFLYVTWPLRYYHRWSSFTDRHVYAQLSRYIDDGVRATCELVSVGLEREVDVDLDGGTDIGARVRHRLDAIWD